MDFEWDSQKADINAKKHGVSFEEASGVFGDYLSFTYPDSGHSIQEERYIIIGLSSKNSLVDTLFKVKLISLIFDYSAAAGIA